MRLGCIAAAHCASSSCRNWCVSPCPGLTNLWMVLLKDTSYVSIISLSRYSAPDGTWPCASPRNPSSSMASPAVSILVLAILSSFLLVYIDRWAKRSEVPPLSYAEKLIAPQAAPPRGGKAA